MGGGAWLIFGMVAVLLIAAALPAPAGVAPDWSAFVFAEFDGLSVTPDFQSGVTSYTWSLAPGATINGYEILQVFSVFAVGEPKSSPLTVSGANSGGWEFVSRAYPGTVAGWGAVTAGAYIDPGESVTLNYNTFSLASGNLVPGFYLRYLDENGSLRCGYYKSIAPLPPNMKLTLAPAQADRGDTVTASVLAPGATAAFLRCSGARYDYPEITLQRTGPQSFGLPVNTGCLSFCPSGCIDFTARGSLSGGGEIEDSAQLHLTPPYAPPVGVLAAGVDHSGCFGCAEGFCQPLLESDSRLEATLGVRSFVGLWLSIDVSSLGADALGPASESAPERYGVVAPGGCVSWRGTFDAPGQSITFALGFDEDAALLTVLDILLSKLPGGHEVGFSAVAAHLPQVRQIDALVCAARELVPLPVDVWDCAQAANRTAWELRRASRMAGELQALTELLDSLGLTIGSAALGDVLGSLQTADVLGRIGSNARYGSAAGPLTCTFTSYAASGGTAGAAPTQPPAAAECGDSPLCVSAIAAPDTDGWTISYSVSNTTPEPLWSWTLYCDPAAVVPLQVDSPAGWTHRFGPQPGSIIWYTSESVAGWLSGSYGGGTIAPSTSLGGFAVRSATAPGCTMVAAAGTGGATACGETLAPGGSGLVSEMKLRLDALPAVLSDCVVTAVFPDRVYMCDADRSCGVCVTGLPPSIAEGDVVRFSGSRGEIGGEAVAAAQNWLITGHVDPPEPMAMNVRALHSAGFGVQDSVQWGAGAATVGLLVRTWGRVVKLDEATRSLLLDDGSIVRSPEAVPARVRVIVPAGIDLPNQYDFVVATGICSYEEAAAVPFVLRTRRAADVRIVEE